MSMVDVRVSGPSQAVGGPRSRHPLKALRLASLGAVRHRGGMSTVDVARESDRSSVGVGLTTLLASLVALAALTYVALRTAAGQLLDERAMNTVVAGRETQLTVLSVLGYVSIGAVVAVTLVSAFLAVARGRVRLAVAAVAVIAGANVTTQVLKLGILERADLAVAAPNSFPSGHTTVVAAAVGALCLVVPRVLRPVVTIGGAFAVTLTGASTVVAGWHRPADVVGALLVSLAWTAGATVLVGGHHRAVPASWVGALTGAVAALVVLVGIGVRPSYGWSGSLEAALVLGAVAAAVALCVAAMERVTPTD